MTTRNGEEVVLVSNKLNNGNQGLLVPLPVSTIELTEHKSLLQGHKYIASIMLTRFRYMILCCHHFQRSSYIKTELILSFLPSY